MSNDSDLIRIAEEYHQASLQKKPANEKVMKRWKYAHEQMVDGFKYGKELEEAIMDKFGVGPATARLDIQNANDYFLNQEEILLNIDFHRMLLFKWQLKGLAMSYKHNEWKEFNAGIKNLVVILGLNKAKDGMDPKKFKTQIINHFHVDAKKFSHVDIDEAQVVEFIDSLEDLSPHDKVNMKRDAKLLRK